MARQTSEIDKQDATTDRSQAYYDEKFNQITQAQDLSQQEKDAIPGYDKNDGLDDHPVNNGDASGKSGDISKNIKETKGDEANPMNFTGSGDSGKKNITGKGNFIKKKGPTGIIIGLLLAALGIGGSFGALGLLPIHVMEQLTQKFNTQDTSMTIRSNRVLVNKLVDKSTTGSCDAIKIACRFTRPSNYLLKNMAKNNIVALDANGKAIDTRAIGFNKKPSYYEFTDSTGKKLPRINASELSGVLKNDVDFRAAFHDAYNPRYIAWADSIAKSVFARFNLSKQNKLADVKNEKDVTNKINEDVKGADIGAKDGDSSLLKRLLSEKAGSSIKVLSDAGKGSGIQMIAGAACLLANTPKMITSVVRAYQMVQLVSYAMEILTPTSAGKAGAGTVAAMAGIGTLLTTTKDGKSAMDSFGMHNALFGDTKASSDSYKKFSPGGSVIASTGGVIKITDSQAIKDSCGVALNPVTGAALNLFLVANSGETLGVSALGAAVNYLLGIAASAALEKAAPLIIDLTMPLIQPAIQNILKTLYPDLTQNLVGTDAGDALASGASNMMGQVANGGGNIPMTVDQAVSYNTVAQNVQLAYAQEDRATLSPFDASNSNTMMGSFVSKLLPYYGTMSSVSGFLGGIGNIVSTGILGSLFKPVSAADSATQYKLCDDPAITESNIAAGPFCNIYYGVPTEYLNTDPNTVLQYMLDTKQIDEDTGDPVPNSEYSTYMQLCTDGTTDNIDSCSISSQNDADTQKKLSMFSLWTIDHRVQRTADNEDTPAAVATPPATTTPGGATSGGTVKGDDYPWPNSPIGVTNPYTQFSYRECVDFVNWRLNEQAGVTDITKLKTYFYGTANEWKDKAVADGKVANYTPTLGSVAWWGSNVAAGPLVAGPMGHVGIVSAINNGVITIEQYNGSVPDHTYSSIDLTPAQYASLMFLHIHDIGS
jgi:surface antigen